MVPVLLRYNEVQLYNYVKLAAETFEVSVYIHNDENCTATILDGTRLMGILFAVFTK